MSDKREDSTETSAIINHCRDGAGKAGNSGSGLLDLNAWRNLEL